MLRNEGRGGGSATLVTSGMRKDSLRFQVIKKIKINKDSGAVKVRINHLFFIWIVNFYNHDGNIKKMQKLFGELRANIPPSEWGMIYVIGDFNINFDPEDKKFKMLRTLSKHMGLQPEDPRSATHRNGRKIDFVIHGN